MRTRQVNIDLMYSFGVKSGLPLQPRFRCVRQERFAFPLNLRVGSIWLSATGILLAVAGSGAEGTSLWTRKTGNGTWWCAAAQLRSCFEQFCTFRLSKCRFVWKQRMYQKDFKRLKTEKTSPFWGVCWFWDISWYNYHIVPLRLTRCKIRKQVRSWDFCWGLQS